MRELRRIPRLEGVSEDVPAGAAGVEPGPPLIVRAEALQRNREPLVQKGLRIHDGYGHGSGGCSVQQLNRSTGKVLV